MLFWCIWWAWRSVRLFIFTFFCIFITVFMMLLFHEKLVGTCTLHMFTVMQLKLHINIHKLLIQLLFYFWQWHWSWHKGSNEGVCWWVKTGWSQATGWQSLLCAALVGWQTGHMSHKNNATYPQKNKWRKKTGGDLLTQVYLKSSSYNGDVFLE